MIKKPGSRSKVWLDRLKSQRPICEKKLEEAPVSSKYQKPTLSITASFPKGSAEERKLSNLVGQLKRVLDLQADFTSGDPNALITEADELIGSFVDDALLIPALQFLLTVERSTLQQKTSGTLSASAPFAQRAIATMNGRIGTQRTLALLGRLITDAERQTIEDRPALWDALLDLVTTNPLGLDQVSAGLIASLFAEHSEQNDPIAAVAKTKQELTERLHATDLEQLSAPADADQAFVALCDGLKAVATTDNAESVLDCRTAADGLLEAPPDKEVQRSLAAMAETLHQISDLPLRDELLAQLTTFLSAKAPNYYMPKYLQKKGGKLRPELVAQTSFADKLQGLVEADSGAKSRALLLLHFECQKITLAKYPEVEAALERVAAFENPLAFHVALAVLPQLIDHKMRHAAALLDAVMERATQQQGEDPFAALADFAMRFAETLNALHSYQDDSAWAEIAKKVVQQTRDRPFEIGPANELRTLWLTARRFLPDLRPEPVVFNEHAGLFQLVDQSFRHKPTDYFEPVLNALRPLLKADAGVLLFAIETTCGLANLEGEPQIVADQVLKDLAKIAEHPEQVPFARQGIVGLRSAEKPGLTTFREAHPDLPIDLIPAAALYLSVDQIAWLEQEATNGKGRDHVRKLRDVVFATAAAGRSDLLEAIRSPNASRRTVSKTIDYLCKEYRGGHADHIPCDEVLSGLQTDTDTIAVIEKRNADKAIAALKLDSRTGDPDGLVAVVSCAEAIGNLLTFFGEQAEHSEQPGIPFADLKSLLTESIHTVARGEWPDARYDDEVGQRQLSIFDEQQQRTWRQETVTSPEWTPDGASHSDLADVQPLFRGLIKALPQAIRLTASCLDGGQSFTHGAEKKLRHESEVLERKLHGCRKGSRKHKEHGAELQTVQYNLTLVELTLALKASVDKKPTEAMAQISPLLARASAVLRKLKATGCQEAVDQLLSVARQLDENAKKGHFVVDEDGLHPLLMSHLTGCMRPSGGNRRWGLAAAVAEANIKMMRVYRNDQMVCRAFLKFFPVELEGYKGPALWIENPVNDGGGDEVDLRLLFRGAIKKALQLGIPVLSGSDQGYMPSTTRSQELVEEGTKLGLETQSRIPVTFFVREGNAAVQHDDSLFGGPGKIRNNRGDKEAWEHKVTVNAVVMPH